MKKIAFVLNTPVPWFAGEADMWGFDRPLKDKELYTALEAAFGKDYEILLDWEANNESISEADALVLPTPFYPIVNEGKVPEIKIPARLFYEIKAEEIKALVNDYFSKDR